MVDHVINYIIMILEEMKEFLKNLFKKTKEHKFKLDKGTYLYYLFY